MEKYAWLFPTIFIVHDMEEIIGLGLFLRNNKEILEEKYPFVLRLNKDFSTEGFSLAVYEELLLSILITIIALVTNYNVVWYLWLGGFIGCALHFVVHIGQSIILKKYIPAVVTSILLLPISVHIIYKCILTIPDNTFFVLIWIFLGIEMVVLNLLLIHKIIGWYTRKMNLVPII